MNLSNHKGLVSLKVICRNLFKDHPAEALMLFKSLQTVIFISMECLNFYLITTFLPLWIYTPLVGLSTLIPDTV